MSNYIIWAFLQCICTIQTNEGAVWENTWSLVWGVGRFKKYELSLSPLRKYIFLAWQTCSLGFAVQKLPNGLQGCPGSMDVQTRHRRASVFKT